MLFSFGYGYVASFIAQRGTSRSPQGKGHLFYQGGSFSPDILKTLEQANSLLICIPPQGEGDLLIPFIKEILSAFSHLKWIGYLSSTSVYGDHKGEWVDEGSETRPQSFHGLARLKAEHQWIALAEKADLPLHIFRLSGIYGPHRNVLVDLMAGRARRIFKEGISFSRIHVEDIVQTLKASMKAPCPHRIYNVSDNCPSPSHEVISYGAGLLGRDPPPLIPFESASLTPLGKGFFQDAKRVRNERLLRELIPSLLFPSYKEGLREEVLKIKDSAFHFLQEKA